MTRTIGRKVLAVALMLLFAPAWTAAVAKDAPIDPIAYLDEVESSYQVSFLNTTAKPGDMLLFTWTIHNFDDHNDARDAVSVICDDIEEWFESFDQEPREGSIEPLGHDRCAIDGGNESSAGVAIRAGGTVYVFIGGGTDVDMIAWVEDAFESLSDAGTVSLRDTSWIPGGTWKVQTGPQEITDTVQTMKDDRPEDDGS